MIGLVSLRKDKGIKMSHLCILVSNVKTKCSKFEEIIIYISVNLDIFQSFLQSHIFWSFAAEGLRFVIYVSDYKVGGQG